MGGRGDGLILLVCKPVGCKGDTHLHSGKQLNALSVYKLISLNERSDAACLTSFHCCGKICLLSEISGLAYDICILSGIVKEESASDSLWETELSSLPHIGSYL